jgi:hypothetical protein
MRTQILVLTIVLCPLFTFSQRWSPAKIVLASGDTLRGEGLLKYDTIRFRPGPAEKSSAYGPEVARVIYMDGKIFASSEFIGLTANAKAVLNDQFFMTVLMLGDVSLYYHINKSNRDNPAIFFIKKGDEPAFQLINSITTTKVDGVEYRKVNAAYRDQLKNLFADCPSVSIYSGKDYYREKAMLELVSSYVSCRNFKTSYRETIVSKKPEFHAITGIDVASFNLSVHQTTIRPPSDYDIYPKSSSSAKPFFGLQMALAVDRREKVSLLAELFYNQLSTSHTLHTTPSGFQEQDQTTTIIRNYLRLNVGARRNLRLGSGWSANLHAGLSFAFVVKGSYDADVTTKNLGTGVVTNSTYSLSNDFQSTETGFFGGAGLQYKKVGLLARYESVLSFSANNDFSASVLNMYLGLSYKFVN